jgi:hypothetical protein
MRFCTHSFYPITAPKSTPTRHHYREGGVRQPNLARFTDRAATYSPTGATTLNTSVRIACSTASVRPRAFHAILSFRGSAASRGISSDSEVRHANESSPQSSRESTSESSTEGLAESSFKSLLQSSVESSMQSSFHRFVHRSSQSSAHRFSHRLPQSSTESSHQSSSESSTQSSFQSLLHGFFKSFSKGKPPGDPYMRNFSNATGLNRLIMLDL